MQKLGVIIAVPQEARAILADDRYSWDDLGDGLFESRGAGIRLALCGVGKVFASWACARLASDCDELLGLGTSGGLSDEEVGSLWIVDEFVEHDMDVSTLGVQTGVTPFSGMEGPVIRSAPSELVARARSACMAADLPAGRCRSATGDSFIADSARARELGVRTGARLCDMESAAIAKLCVHRARLPFIALRAVSDNADHQAHRSWAEQVEISCHALATFLWEFVKGE